MIYLSSMKTVLFALSHPAQLPNSARWEWYKLEPCGIDEVQKLNLKLGNKTLANRIVCSCETIDPTAEPKEGIWERLQEAKPITPNLCLDLLETAQ